MKKTYDTRCFELAQYFLPNGTQEQLDELATDIQMAVEDFLICGCHLNAHVKVDR